MVPEMAKMDEGKHVDYDLQRTKNTFIEMEGKT